MQGRFFGLHPELIIVFSIILNIVLIYAFFKDLSKRVKLNMGKGLKPGDSASTG
jgi:hypothetical protein